MKKKIGSVTTYLGTEHRHLLAIRVRIVAVTKGAARDDFDPDADEAYPLTEDADIDQHGGVTADDRVEVQPWIAKEGRYSLVSSDPKAADLACFRHLRKRKD